MPIPASPAEPAAGEAALMSSLRPTPLDAMAAQRAGGPLSAVVQIRRQLEASQKHAAELETEVARLQHEQKRLAKDREPHSPDALETRCRTRDAVLKKARRYIGSTVVAAALDEMFRRSWFALRANVLDTQLERAEAAAVELAATGAAERHAASEQASQDGFAVAELRRTLEEVRAEARSAEDEAAADRHAHTALCGQHETEASRLRDEVAAQRAKNYELCQRVRAAEFGAAAASTAAAAARAAATTADERREHELSESRQQLTTAEAHLHGALRVARQASAEVQAEVGKRMVAERSASFARRQLSRTPARSPSTPALMVRTPLEHSC